MAVRRGDAAKEFATKTIIEAFGDSFLSIKDKKIFVEVKDGPGGEPITLSIALTMPKMVAEPPVQTTAEPTAANIETADQDKITELRKLLGL